MLRSLAVSLLSLMVVLSAAASDPAAALAEAKAQIGSRNYSAAVNLLRPAIQHAGEIEDEAQKAQALTALHFYAAVAYSGLAQEADAVGHLREALRLSPNLRNIDAKKYDAAFVALFQRERTTPSPTGRFEETYPGYSESGAESAIIETLWENVALDILGSRREKRDWEAAVSPAQREQFMRDFWLARESGSGSDFRRAFTRRVAFADATFELSGQRGAMTDRGRVFAVLGVPASVRRRPLSARDQARLTAFNVGSVGLDFGSVESWTYTRDQLPVASPASSVTFRFVTHQGIGDYVLQQDGIPMNVLATAAAGKP